MRLALVGLAAGCAVLFAILNLVADRTLVGQQADDVVFRLVFGFVPGGWPADAVSWVARDFVVQAVALGVLVLSVAAVVHHRWWAVVHAAATVSLSVLATLYLRDHVLVRERLQPETFPINSMPSTHASAATALVIAGLILWPRIRPWWLLNAAAVLVLLVVVGNIESQAHRPSDVVASLLLVAAVAAVFECASVGATTEPDPGSSSIVSSVKD